MNLGAELSRVLDRDRVLTGALHRLAYANDASVYRLVPQAVVRPRSIAEVQGLFRFSHLHRIPLTFRAAGTSLSGQAVTDGILVDASRHWRGLAVLDGGRRVRVQPGVIGGFVNQHLARYGTKLGPDPASINACMLGGILANNSSGMCCGVTNNAYHTLDSMVFVLPNGLILDSAAAGADQRLRREGGTVATGLLELRASILRRPELVEKIRAKYRMKNTMGYSLNALIDFERPIDILSHLLIGSEGTLAFIAEATLRTIADHALKCTGLLFFPDVPRACAAIAPLRDSGAAALELMDRASLRAVEAQPGMPASVGGLNPEAAALLVEYQCADEEELAGRMAAWEKVLPSLPLLHPPAFTRDASDRDALWRVRKGLIPSVGAVRARGTSFLIEDVVFPVERLADGVRDLQSLLGRWGYRDAIVFGHAKDGNLHFILTQAFDTVPDVERYDGFMRALCELVATRYGGALKAEHGTGRNMAPFVATEWGPDAYELMRRIKRLVDPEGLLSPGVLVSDDPRAHLTHLKTLPTVEAEVDQCIECGFCERVCPSRDLTLTPRQRIVVRRAHAWLREHDSASELLREVEDEYPYAGIDTCAADGMCATACPVGIDTGQLIKRLRSERHPPHTHERARAVAESFRWTERGVRLALRASDLARRALGDRLTGGLVRLVHEVSEGLVPRWDPGVPAPARRVLSSPSREGAVAVYFPSCVTRVLGADPRDRATPPLAEVVVAVCARAGCPVWIPPDASGLCCGMPFSSKGFPGAAALALGATVEAMWAWSDQGRLPIVVDTSPCTLTLRGPGASLPEPQRQHLARLRILDSVEFAHDAVLPQLDLRRRAGRVVLHPVCSLEKMGLTPMLRAVVGAGAEEVVLPLSAGCCGFAGDRGWTHPELTAAATRTEAHEVGALPYDGYYSSSRTCEVGMARATGRPYRSFWHLLDEASRAPEGASAARAPQQGAEQPRTSTE